MRNTKCALCFAVVTAVLAAALTAATAVRAAPAKSIPPSPLTGLIKQVQGKTLAEREAILYNLAQKEGGALNWYTSLSSTINPKVRAAFEAKYPGIKVTVYRGASEDITAKIISEESAGVSGADVVESNGTEMSFFQHRKDVLIPYRLSPYAKDIPAVYRFNTWTADRLEAFVTAWNTKLVPAGQEPKSWEDLASPRWAGKLAMEPTDIDWFAAVYQSLEKQKLAALKPKPATAAAKTKALKKIDAQIEQLFRGIAKNAQLVPGHTTQATLLAAGQFQVCVSCHAQSIEALINDKKAPITFSPFAAPPVIRAQGIGIVYRLQHPATAMLFYDWLISKDGGQAALLAGGANPARPDMADPQLLAAKTKVLLDLRPIVAHFKAWSDKYDAIVRQHG
jgi:iron(III) transport system substrate-binding protein